MIVLAGGIGSGKSVVARILRLKGYGVYDCDFEAKKLMNLDPALREAIIGITGKNAYGGDGKLDRSYLASRIFEDNYIRGEINSVVHAAVRKDVVSWLEKDKWNIFVETAIASESGLAEMAVQIWFVEATIEQRISRVRTRDSRTEDDILKIIEVQKREEDSLLHSGKSLVHIHNNSGDLLLDRINQLCDSIDPRFITTN